MRNRNIFILGLGFIDGVIIFILLTNLQPVQILEPINSQLQSVTHFPSVTESATSTQTIRLSTKTLLETMKPRFTDTLTPSPTPGEGVPIRIGDSFGHRGIEVFRFGIGKEKRTIVAGIHGSYESNTTALAFELISYLQKNPKEIPPDIELFILPSLNPDGEARPGIPDGRLNDHGVDLNRNWDANWKATWLTAGCWNMMPVSAGEKPFSEPETKALADFLIRTQVKVLISYHSAGLGIFPGGIPVDRASKELASLLANSCPYPYPAKFSTCELTGQLVDWAANHGIAAVDIELTNHQDTDLLINLKILKAFLSWNFRE